MRIAAVLVLLAIAMMAANAPSITPSLASAAQTSPA
jgi:hypothetical protein